MYGVLQTSSIVLDFLVELMVENLPANAGDITDAVRSLGRADPLEEGMATHCSILAWRIPWMEEPGGLQSWGCKSQTRVSTHIHTLCVRHLLA